MLCLGDLWSVTPFQFIRAVCPLRVKEELIEREKQEIETETKDNNNQTQTQK